MTGQNADNAGEGREEAEKEKKKMEAIGTLAGRIAHDFNNILMGLQGHISMMLFDLEPDHPHRMKLEKMESYIFRGADLTKQLLGFARGGKYDVETDLHERPADQNRRPVRPDEEDHAPQTLCRIVKFYAPATEGRPVSTENRPGESTAPL